MGFGDATISYYVLLWVLVTASVATVQLRSVPVQLRVLSGSDGFGSGS